MLFSEAVEAPGVTFREKLKTAIARNDSLLCVGLDPEVEAVPAELPRSIDGVVAFNRAIVEATSDLVCAYKPNFSFFEALGPEGWTALQATIRAIPPHVPIVADAKRG